MSRADYLAGVPAYVRPALEAAHVDAVLKGPEDALEVLNRFEQGESIADIAESLGITHQAIYRHLLTHCPQTWQEYQAAKALANFDDQDEALDQAQDKIALGRAREKLGHARWTLERAARKFYAPDSTTINNTVVIGDPSQVRQEIAILEERLGIEGEIVDNTAQSVHEQSQDQHTHVMSNPAQLPKK